ncbi:MAG: NAD+ synthase [Firmicutes bacterium]|nr:NAD+ synthase [Bacillota bacterium]
MRELTVALVQMNSVVGDVGGNLAKMTSALEFARDGGAQLVVFPEMCLAGYPPEDLLFRSSFLSELADANQDFIAKTQDVLAVWGYAYAEEALYNTAVIAFQGTLVGQLHKHHLPNYGVFDEERYFSPGDTTAIVRWDDWKLGVSICEDLWYPDGPYLVQARHGANLLINISASPFSRGKQQMREQMMGTRADDAAAYLLWTNMVGAQDELVFDGQSTIFSPGGQVLARAHAFEEDVLQVTLTRTPSQHRRWIDPRWRLNAAEEPVVQWVVTGNLGRAHSPQPPRLTSMVSDDEALYRALVLGVRDYVEKNRFGDVVIGLSGGIDSALTACIAVDALGAGRVHGVLMPSSITSHSSRKDALDLAQNLGVETRELPIADVMAEFMEVLRTSFGNRPIDLTEENLQARIRGTLLMALSNKMGWLVLTTGNKSELATGYSTLYGDMAGGFAVLKDVLKVEVFRLSRWVNSAGERIPHNVLIKPPSAELRPDQKDEDSLPPYEILDKILAGYIEDDLTADELIRAGLPQDAVDLTLKLVNRNEYKRRQAPVGIKVTPRAFGRDRRMPITGRF